MNQKKSNNQNSHEQNSDGLSKVISESELKQDVDNEVDNLLNNYGVDTEVSKNRYNMDERLERMRQRVIQHSPTSQQIALKKSPVTTLLWLIGCLLLIALLIVQYAVFNINTLIKDPEHNAQLIEVCELLSCSLPSANLNELIIQNLQHEATTSNQTNIKASITNQGAHSQLYPNLKVSISGQNGLIGEFVAEPKDYLLSEEQTEIASTHENYFMFTIPVDDTTVSNIDIQPFY